jgi:gamma-glutamyltranspeptidase/glutathione hydrolase
VTRAFCACYLFADLADVCYEKRMNPVKAIKLDRATPSSEIGAGKPAGYEAPQTTHFSIVDAEGNAVANTYTLNGWFGSGVVARGTGVVLNNEMDDFTSKPRAPNLYGAIQSERNAIAPRKRPLSSMTPTFVRGRMEVCISRSAVRAGRRLPTRSCK